MRARFRALTTEVEASAADPEVAAVLAAVVSSFPAGRGPAALCYRLERTGALRRDGDIIYRAEDPLDLVPTFEGDLYREAIRRSGDRWVLHAAGVVIDGAAVVLAGDSGDGKSSAALALVAAGAEYLGDEHVAIDGAGRVWGLTRPIAFLGHRPPPAPPGFATVSYPIRDRTGARVDNPLLCPPAAALVEQPVALGALLRIRHRARGQPEVRRLGAGAGLAALWELTLNTSRDTLAVATAVVSRVTVDELCTSSVESLVEVIGPERR